MQEKFHFRLTPMQKNILYLIGAVIAGLVIYKIIGPNPPLTDKAHYEIEEKAKELDKRRTEDIEGGNVPRQQWQSEDPH
ncbi:hypothetical protein LG200_05680 [Methylobacillus caricis]|uniref:hypothetical protein n=1 Tax=Methylobacillus caricis TaxID=1971611 RepID=UPI001CFFEBE0|nr:hypothetical protein [Methylobacillus caricis]MCB5187496.1 hypothetical protein [Methylobacillus caricis]